MTGMISLFLSSVMAASPTTPLPWFEMDDYPIQAVQQRKEGTTAFDLIVSPAGKPINCSVTKSSGSGLLDQRACLVAMRKARFSPALGADGQPTYGVYRSQVKWTLDPYQWAQMEVGPDVELNLSKLPDDANQPIDIKFAYLVDPDGKTAACTAIGPKRSPVLAKLGCEQLSKTPQTPVALKSNGVVPAVRTAWVRFAPTN